MPSQPPQEHAVGSTMVLVCLDCCRPAAMSISTCVWSAVTIRSATHVLSSGSNSARHWLLGNVPGHVLKAGFSSENATAHIDIMQPYHGPHPPAPGTPGRTDYVHVYGQFAWKQPTPTIKFAPMDPNRHSCAHTQSFIVGCAGELLEHAVREELWAANAFALQGTTKLSSPSINLAKSQLHPTISSAPAREKRQLCDRKHVKRGTRVTLEKDAEECQAKTIAHVHCW
jgi:hypothetical protein